MTKALRKHMPPNMNYARADVPPGKRPSLFTTPVPGILEAIESIAWGLGTIGSSARKSETHHVASVNAEFAD